MKLEDIKKQQIEEETELFDELVQAKLDALFRELQLLGRTTALKQDTALGVIITGFGAYTAALAVETDSTRDAFLADMGTAFDEALEDDELGAVGDVAEELAEQEETALKELRQTSGLPPA